MDKDSQECSNHLYYIELNKITQTMITANIVFI